MTQDIFGRRAAKLFYYSPYNFKREIAPVLLLELESQKIENWTNSGNSFTETFVFPDGTAVFYLKNLTWDSDFFKIKTVKLTYCLFNCCPEDLQNACQNLKLTLKSKGFQYCFIEILAGDIILIQTLTSSGYKLMETRPTYFNPDPVSHNSERFSVRRGTLADIPNLRAVASSMQNDYDRFHADAIINPEIADDFLAKYVEEALKGFCDVVLVSDEPDLLANSFLTANYNKAAWQKIKIPVSKMVLSAVSAQNT